jgi:hypothetical protein
MAAATVVPHSLADIRLTPAAVTPAAATVVVVAATLLQRGRQRLRQRQGQRLLNLPVNRCSRKANNNKRKRVQFKSDITGLDSIDELIKLNTQLTMLTPQPHQQLIHLTGHEIESALPV